jgi:hypothetical protein
MIRRGIIGWEAPLISQMTNTIRRKPPTTNMAIREAKKQIR